MSQSNKGNSIPSRLWWLLPPFCIVGLLIWGIVAFHNGGRTISNRITSIERRISSLQSLPGTSTTAASNHLASIEFLKEEMSDHRAFIEGERNVLLWFFGITVSIFGAAAGFYGVRTRAEIRTTVDEIIAATINDDIGLKFIKRSVREEREALGKNVCFIRQENSSLLDAQIALFKRYLEPGRVTTKTASDNLFAEENINKLVVRHHIVILEVSPRENNPNADDPTFQYRKLDYAVRNTERNRQCVLYCPNRLQVNTGLIADNHTTTVNFASKLRETLFSLLRLMPTED